MSQKRLIELIQDNGAPIPARLSALEQLASLSKPETLVAVCHATFSQSSSLSARARELIQDFNYTECEGIMDLVLDGKFSNYVGVRAFDVLGTEKPEELMLYVVERANMLAQKPERRERLATWLRKKRLTEDWAHKILALPPDESVRLALVLSKIDGRFPLALGRIVKDGAPREQVRAVEILGRITNSGKITSLIMSAMRSKNSELRSKAVLLLGKTSSKIAIVEKAMEDKDPRTRANAIESLWGKDTEGVRKVLKRATRDPNNRVRANAARGLYDLGEPLGLETFEQMLEGSDSLMRMSAAWMLGDADVLQKIPAIRKLLKDENHDVRRNAALALEKMGVRLLSMHRYFRCFKDEIHYFSDGDILRVSYFITSAKALTNLPEEDVCALVDSLLAEHSTLCSRMYQKLELVFSKSNATEPKRVMFMLLCLFAKADPVRLQAVQQVAPLCSTSNFFRVPLQDPSPEIRVAAMTALNKQHVTDARELLESCLTDAEPRVAVNAAEGLYLLRDKKGVEYLSLQLEKADPDVRILVAQAVGRSNVTSLKTHLHQLVGNDPEEAVRDAAAEALEDLASMQEEAKIRAILTHIAFIEVSELPLLRCYLSVLGESGQLVRNLGPKSLTVEEAGIPITDYQLVYQPSRIPINLGVVADCSNNMEPDFLESTKEATAQLLKHRPDSGRVALIRHGEPPAIEQPLTADAEDVLNACNELDTDRDEPPLYSSLIKAVEHVSAGNGIPAVVAFVAGDTSITDEERRKITRYAQNHHTPIYFVDYDSIVYNQTLRSIAKDTHGQYYGVTVSEPVPLICRRITNLLNGHYLLTYTPPLRSAIRGFATLTVVAEHRGLRGKATSQLPATKK